MNENKASIAQAAQQMQRISKRIGDAQEAIVKLGEHSKEIGQIVVTMSGIAGQTNLLALNAAIEAARAGEHNFVVYHIKKNIPLTQKSRRALGNVFPMRGGLFTMPRV